MRASVTSAFAKNIPSALPRRALATAAAALLISAAVPLLPGGTAAAYACGDASASAAGGHVVSSGEGGFIPVVPDSITAGGPAIEVGEEVGPVAGSAGGLIAPDLAFYNPDGGQPGGAALRPADFTVQAMVAGQWKTLPVLPGCDPTIHADTSSVAQQVAAGHAMRVEFRIALSAAAPSSQTQILMFSSPDAYGRPMSHTLKVLRAASPSAKPAAAVAASPAAAQPTPPATAAPRLATTASDSPAAPLFGAGGALVVLGAGAFVLGRRRRSTHR
ncbi:hypothetical protein P3T37_003960 [Kitasatospora sp. MAA4]|uniref:hypothetical protein n=1 Tax=Kitasatospora sp. MAA4 TaxID=3035093 RepID=UPI002475C7A8|nr:hypothetical protein [Kitasatospora sp. MAA4]MDH6134556.1 hypothetical protein [Kitasatospora sp. MAA4]